MLSIWGRTWAVTDALALHAIEAWERDSWAGLRHLAALRLELAPRPEAAAVSAGAGGAVASTRGGTVAVIPVLGLLTQRGRVVDCAQTVSTDALARTIKGAVADGSIGAIVLDMDTPGGEVNGITEAAAVIRAARAEKPIVAAANGDVGSAGYWLFAQATEGYVTPSGSVGSIGVYGTHVDESKALEAQGKRVTIVSAGKYKVERNPTAPLSDEALAALRSDVGRHYSDFVRDVSRGRAVSVERVRDGFGEGRMVGAQAAVKEGMATAIGTLEDAIRRAGVLAGERKRATGRVAAELDRLALD